jgi:uncharacterized sulfatase
MPTIVHSRYAPAIVGGMIVMLLSAGAGEFAARGAEPAQRPNFLWLTCEDMSPHLGCYGEPLAKTPNLDRLARQGVRYTQAFSTSGVCAPSRSCLITGVYPSSLGTQFMRCRGTLPPFIRCFSGELRDQGYYCSNNVKTDYNFTPPASAWDESSRSAHWRNRPTGIPFFAVFNNTVTHESQVRLRGEAFEKIMQGVPRSDRHDPAVMVLPPYYPDTPEARQDWAQYFDVISAMDGWVGEHLARLDEAGLADDTIVFFFSDHGVGLPRAKRWLYDSGTHVPLIVRFGRNFRHLAPAGPGTATDRLVSFVDFAPTILSLAGAKIPEHMQGVPFLGAQQGPARKFVFGLRDRMDETHDLMRSVRDRRYKYIRNDMPWVPYAQVLPYAELGPTLQSMRRLHAAGQLSGPAALFFRTEKPPEELYDTEADPHELVNLAGDPNHQETLARLRARSEQWREETLDLGLIPEPDLHARCGALPPYVVARRSETVFPLKQIRRVAGLGQDGWLAVPTLVNQLREADPAVRYWALVVTAEVLKTKRPAAEDLRKKLDAAQLSNLDAITPRNLFEPLLKDDSPTVRVAAARALLQFGDDAGSLALLIRELASPHEWVRHHAALALVDLGPRAASARPALEEALHDQNEYVRRLAKRGVGEAPSK